MGTMRSSMRRHPSYQIPEPRSHVRVLDGDGASDDTELAPVISLEELRFVRDRRRLEAVHPAGASLRGRHTAS